MATFEHTATQKVDLSKTKLKARYYLVRDNTTATPLIPLDELPQHIALLGVSRTLRPDEVEHMTCIGVLPHPHRFFQLDASAPKRFGIPQQVPSGSPADSQSTDTGRTFVAPDFLARRTVAQQAAAQRRSTDVREILSWRDKRNGNRAISAHDIQSTIDALAAFDLEKRHDATTLVTVPTIPPSGIIPNQEKKIFCTHWIRTAACDYTQQGCMYKHELPPTEAGFEKLGVRPDMCRWMLEKEVKGQLEVPEYLRRMLKSKAPAKIIAGGAATVRMPDASLPLPRLPSDIDWMRRIASKQEGGSETDSDMEQEDDVSAAIQGPVVPGERATQARDVTKKKSQARKISDAHSLSGDLTKGASGTDMGQRPSSVATTVDDLIDLGVEEGSSTSLSHDSRSSSSDPVTPPSPSVPVFAVHSSISEARSRTKSPAQEVVQSNVTTDTYLSRPRSRRARNDNSQDHKSSPLSDPRGPSHARGKTGPRQRVPTRARTHIPARSDSTAATSASSESLAALVRAPRGTAGGRSRRALHVARTRPSPRTSQGK